MASDLAITIVAVSLGMGMDAMTMGFPVPEASEWAKLKPGMKIRGTVVEKKDDFYLTAIQEEK